ncbi:MAG: hypothetical protein GDA39_06110 [Hyphomonadaceae bacterium]|nr:hypothetical protein [Hyphomonadaceae bacterium]
MGHEVFPRYLFTVLSIGFSFTPYQSGFRNVNVTEKGVVVITNLKPDALGLDVHVNRKLLNFYFHGRPHKFFLCAQVWKGGGGKTVEFVRKQKTQDCCEFIRTRQDSGKRHRKRHSQSGSVIFLSPDTSAATSIGRIFRVVFRGKLKFTIANAEANILTAVISLEETAPPEYGHLLVVRIREELPASWISPKYRYIVNLRDPRDRLCNIYHWWCYIKNTNYPPHDHSRAVIAKEFRKMGIDKWVIWMTWEGEVHAADKVLYVQRPYDQILRVIKEVDTSIND